MSHFIIDDDIAANDFISYFKEENLKVLKIDGLTINVSDNDTYTCSLDYKYVIDEASSTYSPLIFGKDRTEQIVALEIEENKIYMYFSDGSVRARPFFYWVLSNEKLDRDFIKLKGDLHYKYIKKFKSQGAYRQCTAIYKREGLDFFTIYDQREAAMAYYGITLFKGMKISELSILSFDLETSGLVMDDTSQVFTIANTFRSTSGEIQRKLFRLDHYKNDGEMILEWSKWVRKVSPAVITGHNIYRYDLPYLSNIARKYEFPLCLGKNSSAVSYAKNTTAYRVDGSQTWDFHKIKILGRHVIDTMFLAVKYDIGRNYPSWGLKSIIEHEGLIKEGRQFYDASSISRNWNNLEEREKICAYCTDDGDDALALFDLMAPSFFYMNQSIPKPFQRVIESASGAWLNSILIRAYIQNGHSIPKSDEPSHVSGGISFGIPGIHKNVFKIDVASLYPSIIRQFRLFPKNKDINGYYLQMADHFTEERLTNKKKYKITKDEHYNDLQASQKILINSLFGLEGAPGLNFNDFSIADTITGIGRQIIRYTIKWATGEDIKYWWSEYESEKDNKYSKVLLEPKINHNFIIVNADTDSISFKKSDSSDFTNEESVALLSEINSILPEMIKYEDDGMFDTILVLKAKNYCLVKKGQTKIKKKGSSIKDSKKEPALQEMLDAYIEDLIFYNGDNITEIYLSYIKEAKNITDISRWSMKKNITKAVLTSPRSNETKILDALAGTEVREGDKVFLYCDIDGEVQESKKGELVFLANGNPKMIENRVLRLVDRWTGTYDIEHMLTRVYETTDILNNVVDMSKIVKYHLKGNRKKLEEL